jgi:squalene-associated FAD-dependent desaturase
VSVAPPARPTAIVLGAGFAGLSAAVELADAGFAVIVLEKAPRAGGRASSFDDRTSGERVDNGQHLLIAGYRNTRAFLEKIGAARDLFLQGALSVRFFERGGRSFDFRAARGLPAPFHLLAAFLRHPLLSPAEKAAAARAVSSILCMDEPRLRAVEPLRFDAWLAAHGQSRRLVEVFWDVVALATINAPSHAISAYPILKVLRLGFFSSARAGRLAYPAVALSDFYAERAAAYLRSRGGDVRLRERVRAIERAPDGRARAAVLEGGGRAEATLFVSALPFRALAAIAPDLVPAGLRPSPIVGVHLWLDREVLDAPFAALLGAPTAQWVWNRRRMLRGGKARGGLLSVTISGAEEALGLVPHEIEARVLADLCEFLPAAREARIERALTIKEPHATLWLEPGTEARRPGPRTRVPNLFLAGDWTATGLPSTIEGAVISGLRAVEEATGRRLVRPLEALEDFPARAMKRLSRIAAALFYGRRSRIERRISANLRLANGGDA